MGSAAETVIARFRLASHKHPCRRIWICVGSYTDWMHEFRHVPTTHQIPSDHVQLTRNNYLHPIPNRKCETKLMFLPCLRLRRLTGTNVHLPSGFFSHVPTTSCKTPYQEIPVINICQCVLPDHTNRRHIPYLLVRLERALKPGVPTALKLKNCPSGRKAWLPAMGTSHPHSADLNLQIWVDSSVYVTTTAFTTESSSPYLHVPTTGTHDLKLVANDFYMERNIGHVPVRLIWLDWFCITSYAYNTSYAYIRKLS